MFRKALRAGRADDVVGRKEEILFSLRALSLQVFSTTSFQVHKQGRTSRKQRETLPFHYIFATLSPYHSKTK